MLATSGFMSCFTPPTTKATHYRESTCAVESFLVKVSRLPSLPLTQAYQTPGSAPPDCVDKFAPSSRPADFQASQVQLSLPGVKQVEVDEAKLAFLSSLNQDQKHAMAVQANQACSNHSEAYGSLLTRVQQLGYSESDLQKCLEYLDKQAPLTVNLPPKVTVGDTEVSVFKSLQGEGRYKNLWERGGRRAANPKAPQRSPAFFLHKESKTFQAQYNAVSPRERPKYGALNPLKLPQGGASVFGRGVLILKPEVKQRTTYVPRDSRFTEMDQVGFQGAMAGCLAAKSNDYLRQVMDVSLGNRAVGSYQPEEEPGAFTGSNYIEAHIHGDIDLANDLAGVALDRCYQGTQYAQDAEAFALQFKVPLEWYGDPNPTQEVEGFIFR